MTYRLTRDEPRRFTSAFNFLSASKNSKHDDVRLEASFLVLGDLPIEATEAAAKQLSKESNSFFPDDGSWYEVADNIACKMLVENTEKARYLTEPKIQEEEIANTLSARKTFVSTYEQFTGKTLPETHHLKSKKLDLMTFHCAECADIGWRDSECTTDNLCELCRASRNHLYDHSYVFRCACWMTNPLLEARRASAKLSSRRKLNAR
jgi:hypothetical protein